MLEMVAGVGHKKSLRDVIGIIDEILRKKSGIPRLVTGHAEIPEHEEDHVESVNFEARRDSYDADFDQFIFRIQASAPILAELTASAEGFGDACSHTQGEDGSHVFEFPPNGTTNPDAARQAVDELSTHMRLPEVWRFNGDRYRTDPISTEMLFRAMLQYKASDIHLAPGEQPIFRVDNQTHHADILGILSAAQIGRASCRERV